MMRLLSSLGALILCASCTEVTGPVHFAHRCATFDGEWRCFDFNEAYPDWYPLPVDLSEGCYRDYPRALLDDTRLDWTVALDYAANPFHQCIIDTDHQLHCDTNAGFDVERIFQDDTGFRDFSIFQDHGYYHPRAEWEDWSPMGAATLGGDILVATLGYPESEGRWELNAVDVEMTAYTFYWQDQGGDVEGGGQGVVAQDVDLFTTTELIAISTESTIPETNDMDCYETYILSLRDGDLSIHEPVGYCVEGLRRGPSNFKEMTRVFTEEAPDSGGYTSISGGVGGACVLDEEGLATCWGLRPGNCKYEDCDLYITSPPIDSRWAYINPQGLGITHRGKAAVWTADEVIELPECWEPDRS